MQFWGINIRGWCLKVLLAWDQWIVGKDLWSYDKSIIRCVAICKKIGPINDVRIALQSSNLYKVISQWIGQ
jgi:hypothetical protein